MGLIKSDLCKQLSLIREESERQESISSDIEPLAEEDAGGGGSKNSRKHGPSFDQSSILAELSTVGSSCVPCEELQQQSTSTPPHIRICK